MVVAGARILQPGWRLYYQLLPSPTKCERAIRIKLDDCIAPRRGHVFTPYTTDEKGGDV